MRNRRRCTALSCQWKAPRNRIAGAAAHHTPRAAVQTMARFEHVDDVAAIIERIGSLIGENEIFMVFVVHLFDGSQGVEMAHGQLIGLFAGFKFRHVFRAGFLQHVQPGFVSFERVFFQRSVEQRHGGTNIPHDWYVDTARVFDFFRIDVDLDEFHMFVHVLPWPNDSIQLSRAPTSNTTSALRSAVERQLAVLCGSVSGTTPLAMDIGWNGISVFLTNSRISSSRGRLRRLCRSP